MDSSLFGYSPEDFKEEARELLSKAENIIDELRANPSNAESVNALFRAIHSVKGSSAYVGFADVNQFAHIYESFLSDVRRKKYPVNDDIVNTLERARDFLEDLVFHPEKTGALTIDDTIEDSYRKVRSALGSGAKPVREAVEPEEKPVALPNEIVFEDEKKPETTKVETGAIDGGFDFIDNVPEPGTSDITTFGQNEVIKLTISDCIKNIHGVLSKEKPLRQEAQKYLSKLEETCAWAFGDDVSNILLPLEEMRQLVSSRGEMTGREQDTLKRGFGMIVPAIKAELEKTAPAKDVVEEVKPAPVLEEEQNEEAQKIRGASQEEILQMTVRRNLEALSSFLEEEKPDAILIQRILTKLKEVNAWAFDENADIGGNLNAMSDLLLRGGDNEAQQELIKRSMAIRTLFTRVLSEERTPRETQQRPPARAAAMPPVGAAVASSAASAREQQPVQSQQGEFLDRRKAPRQQAATLKIRPEDLEDLINTVGKVKGLADKDMETLQGATLKLRMVPVGELFNRFRKVVRDLSEELQKNIIIDIAGESVKLDKAIADKLVEPVMHMVRNAASHGIESQKERDALGKGQAVIRLNAYQEGGQVVIEVSDNGKGISAEKIKKRALDMNLVDPDVLKTMPEKKAIELIFTPGFSTKEGADSVSGRGVGMDVVKEAVTSLQGAIHIDTKEGVGTLFKLQLPLTLAIIRAMVLEQSGVKIAVPAGAVDRVMNMTEKELEQGTFMDKNRLSLYLPEEGEVMPLVNFSQIFSLEKVGDKRCVVLVKVGGGHKAALVVDAALGRQPLTVKPLDNFSETRYFSSASMVEDEVVLILNIPSLLAA